MIKNRSVATVALAIALVVCSSALRAASYTPSVGPVGWGSANSGLQCGLAVGKPFAEGTEQSLSLLLRNVGNSSIAFYDSTFNTIGKGFVYKDHLGVAQDTGTSPRGSFEVASLNAPPGTQTILPGEDLNVVYDTIFRDGKPRAGAYTITFTGLLQPVGESSVPVQCGPVKLNRS